MAWKEEELSPISRISHHKNLAIALVNSHSGQVERQLPTPSSPDLGIKPR